MRLLAIQQLIETIRASSLRTTKAKVAIPSKSNFLSRILRTFSGITKGLSTNITIILIKLDGKVVHSDWIMAWVALCSDWFRDNGKMAPSTSRVTRVRFAVSYVSGRRWNCRSKIARPDCCFILLILYFTQ